MPTESTFPRLDIPDVDLWTFLFERKDREYPDDKGTQLHSSTFELGIVTNGMDSHLR